MLQGRGWGNVSYCTLGGFSPLRPGVSNCRHEGSVPVTGDRNILPTVRMGCAWQGSPKTGQRRLALAVPHELAVFPREETLVGTHPNQTLAHLSLQAVVREMDDAD